MKLFEIAADASTGELIEILNDSEISREEFLLKQDDETCHWDQQDHLVDPKTGEYLHGPDGENIAVKLIWQ
jgi:hypothetical protein